MSEDIESLREEIAALINDIHAFADRAGDEFVTMRSEVSEAAQLLRNAVNNVPRMFVVNNITERDSLENLRVGDQCQVKDASSDATVNAGSALYVWHGTGNGWAKISETESMDDSSYFSSMPDSIPAGFRNGGLITIEDS